MVSQIYYKIYRFYSIFVKKAIAKIKCLKADDLNVETNNADSVPILDFSFKI